MAVQQKNWSLAILVVFLAAMLFMVVKKSTAWLENSGNQPILAVTPNKFECEARETQLFDVYFTVKNLRSSTVRMLGVGTTRGCITSGNVFPLDLTAQSSTTIHMKFRVGKPDDSGTYLRTAQLFVNQEGRFPGWYSGQTFHRRGV